MLGIEMHVTFQNRSATFIWGIAAIWLGMLCVATYVLVRDGVPSGHAVATTAVVVAVFWAAGIGLAILAASRPCYFVEVRRGAQISVAWRYPHKVIRRVIPRTHVEPAVVVDSEGSDGGPYYFARSSVLYGEPVDLVESRARNVCEQACTRFNEALFGRG